MIENVDYVICQICGKHLKRIVKQHLAMHGISKEEYIKCFPNSVLVCESVRKKYSTAAKEYLGKKSKEELSRIGKLRNSKWWDKYNSSEIIQKEYHKNLSAGVSKGIQKVKIENPEKYNETNRLRSSIRKKLFNSPETGEKMRKDISKNVKNYWKNLSPEEKSKRLQYFNNKNWWKNLSGEERFKFLKNFSSSKLIYTIKGKEYKFRSKFELLVGKYLINKKIDFEYESFIVPLDNESFHLIDFYIKDKNLILECKSLYHRNKTKEEVLKDALYKQKQAIQQGYNYNIIYYDSNKEKIYDQLNKIF